jgi:hypothetical protein
MKVLLLSSPAMARCVYCQDRSGFISRVCKDCRKLIAAYGTLEGSFGYRELLDVLLATEIDPDKIELFLEADPDQKGSVTQWVTARMTNELMKDMGLPTEMQAKDVKNVQEAVARGDSYLEESDVVAQIDSKKTVHVSGGKKP